MADCWAERMDTARVCWRGGEMAVRMAAETAA